MNWPKIMLILIAFGTVILVIMAIYGNSQKASEFKAGCNPTEYYTFVRGYASRIYDCSGVDMVESRKKQNIEH